MERTARANCSGSACRRLPRGRPSRVGIGERGSRNIAGNRAIQQSGSNLRSGLRCFGRQHNAALSRACSWSHVHHDVRINSLSIGQQGARMNPGWWANQQFVIGRCPYRVVALTLRLKRNRCAQRLYGTTSVPARSSRTVSGWRVNENSPVALSRHAWNRRSPIPCRR